MKAWEQLTRRGSILRVRELALHALQQYDLDVKSLRLVGAFTNYVLRADTADGTPWLVRAAAHGWRTDEDIRSEMMWLDALRTSNTGAPVPLAARDGSWFVRESFPGVPEVRRITVQSWLPGRNLEHALNAENLGKMGELFARLHAFSAQYQPLAGFTTRRMSHYLARDEENKLFSEENRNYFSAGTLEIFGEVNARVLEAFDSRYTGGEATRVIHNDLWHGNIKVYRGRLLPLDFEDTIWGYPVQDIAMAMQDLMTDVAPQDYEPLLAAFRGGYESLVPWPERFDGEMDLFRAGRVLWVANYVARFQAQYFTDHTAKMLPMLRRFLETGKLRRQTEEPNPAE